MVKLSFFLFLCYLLLFWEARHTHTTSPILRLEQMSTNHQFIVKIKKKEGKQRSGRRLHGLRSREIPTKQDLRRFSPFNNPSQVINGANQECSKRRRRFAHDVRGPFMIYSQAHTHTDLIWQSRLNVSFQTCDRAKCGSAKSISCLTSSLLKYAGGWRSSVCARQPLLWGVELC